ncbi:mannose-6-phosphate isomerase [bacterium G20]|nr:mannose-6-phosphate isomerase [bacterium G20]
MPPKINLEEKIKEIDGRPWYPLEITRANNQVVRIALMKGEYHWHKHEEDEIFYVVRGNLTIQIEDQLDIILDEGEVAVVPKGLKHCPKSREDTYVLMFEPLTLQSGGK